MREKHAILFLIVATLATAVYLNALPGAFQYDDFHHIVDNPSIRNLSNWKQWFTDPGAFSVSRAPMYRPLTLMSLALNYKIGSDNPQGYLILNIVLHGLCTGLVFLLLSALLRDSQAALLAALIFAVHPLQSETVNYINCRSSLLCSLFYLSSLLCIIKASTRAGVWLPWVLAAGLLFGLSLLSKSLAITLPALVVLLLFLPGMLEQAKRSRLLVSVIVLSLIALAYLLLRQETGQWTLVSPEPPRGVLENLLTQARIIVLYLGLIVLPKNLCVDHHIIASGSLLDPRVLFSLMLLGLFTLGSLRFVKKAPWLTLGWLWFLVTLMPTTSIIPLNHLMSEHRLYLPLPGIMLIAAGAYRDLARMLELRGRIAVLTALAILFVSLSILTIYRNPVWATEATLWKDAARKSPQSITTLANLGHSYWSEARPDQAYRTYLQLLEIDPHNFEARVNLAGLMLEAGRYSLAAERFEILVKEKPRNATVNYNLARAYIGIGRFRSAEIHLIEAMNNRQHYIKACLELGRLYQEDLMLEDQAKKTFKHCLTMEPEAGAP